MIYTRPDYYNEFECIADKCADTCCAGWQIVIDEASLEKYKKVEGEHKKDIENSVDFKEGVFYTDEHKSCAFLDSDKLCRLYKKLGKDSLCVTCKSYPRHTEEFENVREISLSLSCPTAAKIILSKNESTSFYSEETDELDDIEEFEDFDPFVYSIIEEARDIMLDIARNKGLDIGFRVYLLCRLTRALQENFDEDRIFDCEEIFDGYKEYCNKEEPDSDKDGSLLYKNYEKLKNNYKDMYYLTKNVFFRLYELEYLKDEWGSYLDKVAQNIYKGGYEEYEKLHKEFNSWCNNNNSINMEAVMEQLLVYFIFTYFCGAVYDGYPEGKMSVTVISMVSMYEMFVDSWSKRGELTIDDVVNVAYRFSRELEHSDCNLDALEDMGMFFV